MAESFVDTFKTELIADRVWKSKDQLELAIVEWSAGTTTRGFTASSATSRRSNTKPRGERQKRGSLLAVKIKKTPLTCSARSAGSERCWPSGIKPTNPNYHQPTQPHLSPWNPVSLSTPSQATIPTSSPSTAAAPWYLTKRTPSFADMLAKLAARSSPPNTCQQRPEPPHHRKSRKYKPHGPPPDSKPRKSSSRLPRRMVNQRILGAVGAKLITARDAMGPEGTPSDSYLALAELVRRYGGGDVAGAPDGSLSGHELRVFSQNGEHGVIAELIRRHGAPSREFVEFGAGAGHENNCAFLADILGWDGLFIEADFGRHAALAAKYRGTAGVRLVKARVSPATLERTLRDAAVQPEPDVLSIDVDGQALWLWRSLERIRPRILVIEYNSSLAGDQSLVQPASDAEDWDGTEYFGASLSALEEVGREKGYVLAYTELTGNNAFFVRADLVLEFPANVPRRGPNHFLAGGGHPSDPRGRPFERYVHGAGPCSPEEPLR